MSKSVSHALSTLDLYIGFSGWYGIWYRFWYVIFSIYQHNYVLVVLTIFKIGGYQNWANILIFKQTRYVMTTQLIGGGKTFQLCHNYQTNWRRKDFSAISWLPNYLEEERLFSYVMTTKLIGGGKTFQLCHDYQTN